MLKLIKVLNFLLISYFILRTELVNNIIPSIWFIFFVLIFFMSFMVMTFMKFSEINFLFKKNIWVLVSLVILLVYKYNDYGNFRLDYMIQYLILSIPFLIIGYFYSIRNKSLKQLILPLILILFLIYLPIIFSYTYIGDYNREFLKTLIFRGNDNSGLIHFWPFISALIVMTWGIYKSFNMKKSTSFILVIIGFSNVFFLFISDYMSGVFFLIVAIISIFLFNRKVSIRSFIFFPILGYLLFLLISILPLGTISFKIKAIGEIIDSGLIFDETILNIATSNRFSADIYSISQFLKKPFFGHGIFLESTSGMYGDSLKYTTASGGHSFFIDLLAFMGISSIPIFLVYVQFIRNSKSVITFNSDLKNLNIAIYGIFISVFISNVFNSWLLFSSFDNFIFLLAGYSSGQKFKSDNIKFITNRFNDKEVILHESKTKKSFS